MRRGIHGCHWQRDQNTGSEDGKLLETYFGHEIAPYLSANIISKQQPFPFLQNKEIYAVARLLTKNGKNKTAVIPCSNNVFKRLIEIPTRPGNFMLSEEIVLHFLPKLFVKYHVVEKSLLRVTRNADIDTETIYDEDLDYRDAMENLIKQRKRMIPWFLWGETIDQTNVLLVAPNCLQNKILAMMDDEICHAKNGEEAYIGVKINSLTDKDIIEKLVEASQAGVKIEDSEISGWIHRNCSMNRPMQRKNDFEINDL